MKTSNLISNYKKATIELLLLKLLSEQDMYGYQLSQELKKRSNHTILEGSMYPILYRLSDDKMISFHEEKTGKRQTRIYYHLEESGFSRYKKLLESYREYSKLIEFLIHSKEGDVYE